MPTGPTFRRVFTAAFVLVAASVGLGCAASRTSVVEPALVVARPADLTEASLGEVGSEDAKSAKEQSVAKAELPPQLKEVDRRAAIELAPSSPALDKFGGADLAAALSASAPVGLLARLQPGGGRLLRAYGARRSAGFASSTKLVVVQARGGVDGSVARRLLRRRLNRFRRCYDQQLRVEPSLTTMRLAAVLVVEPTGKVASVRLSGPARARPILKTCTEAVFRNLKFPSSKKNNAMVNVVIKFRANPAAKKKP